MSVHFNIPFNGLCQGMQVMHRAGFSVTALNTDYAKSEPQAQATTSKSNLKEKSVELSPTKSSSAKNKELRSENKAEITKADKKSSQRNRRQRRI